MAEPVLEMVWYVRNVKYACTKCLPNGADEIVQFREISRMFEDNDKKMVPRNFKWHNESIQEAGVTEQPFRDNAFENDPDHVWTRNRVLTQLILQTMKAWRIKKYVPIKIVTLNILVDTMQDCIEKAGPIEITTIESLMTVHEAFTKVRDEILSGFSQIYSNFYSNPASMLGSPVLPEVEEEESYEENRDRLQIERCTNVLVRIIDISVLWPLLRKRIFNDDVVNVANWEKTLDREDTVRHILSTIKALGSCAYNVLVQSLRETSNVLSHATAADLLERKICFPANEPGASKNCTTLTGPNISDDECELNELIALIRSDKRLVIDVTPATRFVDVNDGGIVKNYKMSTNPRGRVLILSVAVYDVLNNRKAGVHDRNNLCALFRALGFEVIAPDLDLTASKITRYVREFSQRDFSNVDSCFVIISAHGTSAQYNGALYAEIHGYDSHKPGTPKVLCKDIVDMFSTANCPQLKDKPKVFIFQACRNLRRLKPKDANIAEDLLIPQEYSNTLIVHSTMLGRFAYSNPGSGSYYITILCYVFMHYAHNSHIEDLFKKVQALLKKVVNLINETQTPTVKNISFEKNLYLNPGIEKNS